MVAMWFSIHTDRVRRNLIIASIFPLFIEPYVGLSPSSAHLCEMMA